MTHAEEILEKLKGNLPGLRRAELEQKLYDLLPRDRVRDKHGMPEALRKAYGLPFYEVKQRITLRLAGVDATPLWAAVDDGLALNTAVNLLREARRRAHAKGTRLDFEIEEGLAAYEDRTVQCRTAGGKRYRRRPDARFTPDVEKALDTIREASKSYVSRAGVTLDRTTRARLSGELMAEIEAILKAFALRVAREEAAAKTDKQGVQLPIRREVVDACEVLGIRSPAPGTLPDLVEAKKRFRFLTKQYHPDTTGSDASRGAFEAVVRAFELLKRLVDQQPQAGAGA